MVLLLEFLSVLTYNVCTCKMGLGTQIGRENQVEAAFSG